MQETIASKIEKFYGKNIEDILSEDRFKKVSGIEVSAILSKETGINISRTSILRLTDKYNIKSIGHISNPRIIQKIENFYGKNIFDILSEDRFKKISGKTISKIISEESKILISSGTILKYAKIQDIHFVGTTKGIRHLVIEPALEYFYKKSTKDILLEDRFLGMGGREVFEILKKETGFNFSQTSIFRVAARHGVYFNTGERPYDKEEVEQIIEEYNKGFCITAISKMFNRNRKYVTKYLKLNGIDIRIRKYKLNENLFEKIDSEEKAYWLGFIVADGNIMCHGKRDRNPYSYRLTIALQLGDIEHLEKFKKFLETDNRIFKYKSDGHDMCSIRINCKKMANDFIKLGVMENKCFKVKPMLQGDTNERHYYRGLIDGDGCIYRSNNQGGISLTGNQFILPGFVDFFKRSGITVENQIYKKAKSYTVDFGGNRRFIETASILYDDSNIYLDRKKKLFEKIRIEYKNNNPIYYTSVDEFKNIVLSAKTGKEAADKLKVGKTCLSSFMRKYNVSRSKEKLYKITIEEFKKSMLNTRTAKEMCEDLNISKTSLHRLMTKFDIFRGQEPSRITKEMFVEAMQNSKTKVEVAKKLKVSKTYVWRLMKKHNYFEGCGSKYLITEGNNLSLESKS